jgi:hypothetical protein
MGWNHGGYLVRPSNYGVSRQRQHQAVVRDIEQELRQDIEVTK